MNDAIELTGSAIVGLVPPPQGLMAMQQMPTKVRLGRKPPTELHTRKLLKLGDYLSADFLASLPDNLDWTGKASASLGRMYLNDQYGDCVIAGKYHTVGVLSANDVGTAAVGTDNEVYGVYQSFCGPGDNGCEIVRVLDKVCTVGVPLNGVTHKIDGYATVDWTNQQLVKAALYLFGNITIGINLPQAWTTNAVWDVTNTQIVGGHDVSVFGYSPQGVTISSWGRKYLITWAAFHSKKWLEEAYTLLGPDWYNGDNVAPNAIDVATLKSDLTKIGGGTVPSLDPPAPPVPPVPPASSNYRVVSSTDYSSLQASVAPLLASGWVGVPGFSTNVPGFYQALAKPTTMTLAADVARVNIADAKKLVAELIAILTQLTPLYPKLQFVILMLNTILLLLPTT